MKIGNNYIRLKKHQFQGNFKQDSDIENSSSQKYQFGDKEVFKIVKENNKISFVWFNSENVYTVNSNISDYETLKFIENIKILKNF